MTGLATIHSRALLGLQAPPVQVEVHLANGLPAFNLVGLADTEVKESRERVRAALANAGLAFPHNKRITVNLAPADLPKDSGRFDLPIALGILTAAGLLDPARVAACEFAGELSLAGELRPVRGALALALAAGRSDTGRSLVLPMASAAEAAHAPRVRVCGATDLAQVVRALQPGDDAVPLPVLQPAAPGPAPQGPDLADVRGQAAAKRALEIAAAGRHSLLMVGPPGSGKTMLAERLPGLLPAMDEQEALTSAALQGLAPGGFDLQHWRQRPFRAPHHSASAVALVGGGSPPRPGEVSLAHAGVLFLDELVEFPRSALEALREPLESRQITVARAARSASFPASFQLVAAMNPCPCGWLGAQVPGRSCRCTPDQVARYQGRLSGPLLDRIDLLVEVAALPPAELLAARPPAGGAPHATDPADPTGVGGPRPNAQALHHANAGTDTSAHAAARVALAAQRQQQRQGRPNARLDAAGLERHARPSAAAQALLVQAAQRLGWSGRGTHRALKLARTVADLAGAEQIEVAHLAEALQYRRALPQA